MGTTSVAGSTASGSSRYASIAEFKAWLSDRSAYLVDADGASIDSELGDVLDAGSRLVDDDTGREFFLTSSEARSFRINLQGAVMLPDLIASVTPTVTIDTTGNETAETTLAATDYVLGPLTDERGRAALRYEWLRRARFGSVVFTPGYKLTVSGDWGFLESGAAPAGVKVATMIQAARLYARRDAKLGAKVIPEVGLREVLSKTDPDYDRLIAPFVRDVWGVS